MYPVFRHNKQGGVGSGYEDFVHDFKRVCQEHKEAGRALGFAFIFYRIDDQIILSAINSDAGFNSLNEVSGSDMTVYFVADSAMERVGKAFNRRFMKELNIQGQAEPPCIVFFRVENDMIVDVSIRALDGEAEEPRFAVAEIRQHIQQAARGWKEQGNLSGINPIPLITFLMNVAGLVAPFIK